MIVPSKTALGIVFVGFSIIPAAVVAVSTPINPQKVSREAVLSELTRGTPCTGSKYLASKKKKPAIGIRMSGAHFKKVKKISNDPAKEALLILIPVMIVTIDSSRIRVRRGPGIPIKGDR